MVRGDQHSPVGLLDDGQPNPEYVAQIEANLAWDDQADPDEADWDLPGDMYITINPHGTTDGPLSPAGTPVSAGPVPIDEMAPGEAVVWRGDEHDGDVPAAGGPVRVPLAAVMGAGDEWHRAQQFIASWRAHGPGAPSLPGGCR